MGMKFYRCAHCGQIVAIVKGTGVPIMCCGEKMQEIVPGTTDAALEKHVPVYEVKDGVVTVTVGSVEHPMLDEHYMEWIALETKMGNQRKHSSRVMPRRHAFRSAKAMRLLPYTNTATFTACGKLDNID